ncbi:hypothetical protein ACFYO1_16905 [Nocardia sp. NPDC006044]|uniref:hypothetical protein n=1 Tax=Nocardia sp. NPDC006044 TaxID=3364306 RepID=UPI00367C46B7
MTIVQPPPIERSHQSRIAFADGLLRAATRPERVAELVDRLVGDRIDTGPIPIGPGGFLSAVAGGQAERIRIEPSETDCCDIAVIFPVTFRIRVGLGGIQADYLGAACIRTRVRLVPQEPCALSIQHRLITRRDVAVRVQAQNLLARFTGAFARVDNLVAEHVVAYVNSVVTSPGVLDASRIDVAELIDRAWDAGFAANPAAARR